MDDTRPSRKSLKTRSLLRLAVLMAGIFLTAGAFQTSVGRQQQEALTERHARLLAGLQAAALSEPVWDMDTRQIMSVLQGLEREPDFASVHVFDPESRIDLADRLKPSSADDIVATEPVLWHGRPLATLEVRLSRSGIDRAARSYAATTALWYSVMMALVLGAVWWILRTILEPLARLRRTMLDLADGNTGVLIDGNDREDEIGQMAGAVEIFQQTAIRIRVREQQLADLQRRHQLILDAADEGIIGLDRNRIIRFVNPKALRLLAGASDEIVGLSFDDIAPAGEGGGAASPTDGTMAYRIFRRRDGGDLPVDHLIAPIIEDGEAAGWVLVFRDATLRLRFERHLAGQQRELERQVAERTAQLTGEMSVRRRVEESLRDSRERLKRVTDCLFEGLITVDRAGSIVFINPAALRQLRWDAAEGDIEGYPLDDVLRIRTRHGDLDFVSSPWMRVITGQEVATDDDAQFLLSSGAVLSVAWACSPLPLAEGRQGAVISFRDIEALKRARSEAIQASRMASVGQLAAGIAHEINTPIQYVGDNLHYIGQSVARVAEVLAEAEAVVAGVEQGADLPLLTGRFREVQAATGLRALIPEVEAAIAESLDGVGQVSRIVLSMKEFSHPGTTSKTLTDLNKALDSTLMVSRNVWKHAAEIDRRFDPDLPRVLCHAGEMNQVFLNLIVNAVHAIESSGKSLPGRISITTRAIGDTVEIRVADSGTGIDDDIRDRIFDPFFTTKEVGRGTGQGLAICRDVVVAKHGGTLAVDGRPGLGAEFVVTLPTGQDETGSGDDPLGVLNPAGP
ncbi:MAG: PAS domain S-box protein [Telmatospirillum sp.]|nr:PAS domain S-box protein [Telmatospirillum sp.]